MRPRIQPVYVLIHSPLVGGLTWSLVADEMRNRHLTALVPSLKDSPNSKQPYWQQHAASVADALKVPKTIRLILVAHSGAGPLLPAIRQAVPNPVHAYVFVDAGIPQNAATRLDLMKAEDLKWAQEFEGYLESGGRFPDWSVQDLKEILPDEKIRQQLVDELRPRGLDFFREPIPVFDGWPDAACVYIQCSAAYDKPAAQAREAGWLTDEVEAGHFHMLVDPKAVTDMIINAISEVSKKR